MALTGFDPEVVKTSLNSVKTAYDNLMKALYEDMQNQFVEGMADKWACNQAQKFFSTFKSSIDSLLTSSTSTFESVVTSMNDAASSWASQTNSSYSKVQFTPNNSKIKTDSIKENIGGVRGIDVDNAKSVAAKLTTIANSAQTALSEAQTAVSECGFMGGNQQANLTSSLGKIKENIGEVVTSLSTEVKSAIDSTVETYSDTEGKISQAFAGK